MAFNPAKVRPLGSRVLLHKCVNEDVADEAGKVLIVLPDKSKECTWFCRVLAVGPKCKIAWPIGATVRVNEGVSNSKQCLDGADGAFWMVDESHIEPSAYE